MAEANRSVFKFYLALIDSFSEYLLKKYSKSSLDNPNHYKTTIIQKIAKMFHTLESISKEGNDEVSSRCVLRGLLDNVATYCFIYQRDNNVDILFRHYLYALDGFKSLKDTLIDGILEENKTFHFEAICDVVILQLKTKLSSHVYYNTYNEFASKVIQNANWKYESIKNPTGITFTTMYKQIGFDDKLANYYQRFLSQFSHGLCLSNSPVTNSEQIEKVLVESIPIADRIIQAICNTFPKEEMIRFVFQSETLINAISQPDFVFDELFDFAKALIRKDKTIIF